MLCMHHIKMFKLVTIVTGPPKINKIRLLKFKHNSILCSSNQSCLLFSMLKKSKELPDGQYFLHTNKAKPYSSSSTKTK